MTNKIIASIEFSFKGEVHTPSMELDLDNLMQRHNTLSNLHDMLAKKNTIDSYSYEYEMLIAEPILFSQAQGLAKQFLHNTDFDLAGFEQQWHEQKVLTILATSVKQELDIEDLNQHPALKKVLLTAYDLGKNNGSNKDKT